jgi:hypothetical protein
LSSRVRIKFIRLAIVLSSLLLDADLSFASAQAKLDAVYDVTLFGFPIGRIAWTVELRDNRYVAAASGATSGLLRIFSDGHGDVSARGTLSEGQPIASNFALKLVAGKWSDEVRILFSGDRAKEYVNAPARADPDDVPLTDANRKGVVDPITALLVRIPGARETVVPEACERSIAVFDGHTRYNLQLAFKRLDKVKTDTGYQGPVVVCAVKFFPVAGFNPKRFLITYLAAQHDIEIWLAPFAGSRLMVPYRVSIPTRMGLGILQATKFESIPARSPTTSLN